MRSAPPVLLAFAVLALLVVAVPATPTTPPEFDPPPPSVVFGGPERFEGGTIVVGRYVPAPPSRRVVDLLPPATYEAFLASEARRADVGAPEPDLEVDADFELFDGAHRDLPLAESDPGDLRAAAAEVLAATGVRVHYHPLLPDELGAKVPLLLVDEANLTKPEREAIEAARARGVALVSSTEPGALVPAVLEALRTSPFVHRLAEDPLAVVSASREGDTVRVRLAARPTSAEVRDLANAPAGEVSLGNGPHLSFDVPDEGRLPWTTRLVLTWSRGDVTLRRAWRVLDLVGTASRRVLAPAFAEAGAPYAPRVLVQNLKTGEPLAGRRVSMQLSRGETVLARATGTTDPTGSADLRLLVPEATEPGPAELEVDGERFPVAVTSGVAVSVVTDRTLYRPTDEVCVRVMVHRGATGRPVAGKDVTLTLRDVEKRVTTSEHGIASARFRLERAEVGETAVKARSADVAAEAAIRIRAFETPTFLVRVEPESLSLEKGEEAPVVVRGTYVNGAPLVGAEVTVDPGTNRGADALRGVTDAEGLFAFTWKGGSGSSGDFPSITVKDADGHVETVELSVRRRWSPEERGLGLTPLEDAVSGLPARHALHGPPGAVITVQVGAAAPSVVTLDAEGRGELALTPGDEPAEVRLDAEGGKPVGITMRGASRASGRPVLVPARRLYRVGETVDLTVRASDGPVYVDVSRGVTVLRSLSCTVRNGVGTLPLLLEDDLAGPLTLRAWRLEGEQVRGSSVGLLVTRGRALSVTATPERTAYRPAERAVVDVLVRDRQGRPTAATLGYWGVDQALLARAPWPVADEPVFDVLGRSAHDLAPLALNADAVKIVAFPSVQAALGEIQVDADFTAEFRIHHRAAPRHELVVAKGARERFEASLAAARKSLAEAFDRMPLEEIRTAGSIREVLRHAVTGGWLAPESLRDAWGTPLLVDGELRTWRVTSDDGGRWTHWRLEFGQPCRTAGPDLVHETEDDLVRVWEPHHRSELGGRLRRFLELAEVVLGPPGLRVLDAPFQGPATNGLIGIGGGAGGAFAGRGGSRRLGGAGGGGKYHPTVVHVRRDFSPTLCFVPEAIVGPDGRGRLEIPLKDSITTWRLRLVASAADGATGVGATSIRVSQPLHLEPWVASHLTVGDEIDLPVAVRSESEDALEVATALTVTGGLQVLGPDRAVVRVAPGGTQAVTYRLRAVARGDARVRLDAVGGDHADAVERIVHVHAAEREVVHAASGALTAGDVWSAALPVLAAGAPSESRVSVYPSPMAETLAGFDGLIACPHG